MTGVTAGDFALRLALGVLATAVAVAVVWSGWRVTDVFVGSEQSRWGAFLLIAVLAGAARGTVIHLLGSQFAFAPGTDLVLRLGNSISTTVVWLVILTLYANATDEFTSRFRSVIGGIVFAQTHTSSSRDSAVILRALEDNLRGFTLPPAGQEVTSEQMASLARALRDDLVDRIRAASQDLWVFREPVTPALRPGPLLKLSLARLDYSRSFFLLVFAVLGIPNLASLVGPLEALLRVGVALAVIFVCDVLYRRFIRSFATGSWMLHLGYLLTVGVLAGIPMGLYEFFVSDSPWSLLYGLLLTVPIAALPLLESTLKLSERARNDLLTVLAEHDSERYRSLAEDERVSNTELASYLHNSLQSEIQSIISALERAVDDPDKAELGRLSLERLRGLTQRSLDDAFDAFGSLPLDHLNQVVDGWKGILDISLDWEPVTTDAGDLRLATVVQIIEEVASNAVVHGGATELGVRVVEKNGVFHLTLISNAPEIFPIQPGQGSSWLDSFLDKSPRKKEPAPGHTELTFLV